MTWWTQAMTRLLIPIVAAAILHVSLAAAILPQAEPSFNGQINVSAQNSIPDWPKPVRAPAGAPNILLILLDDVGFADASTFGGAAETPALDKLAAEGLRYTRFHTTGLCTPTRAALLAGRNHHRMGFGTVGEAGFPGYNGIWKKGTASVAEILRRHGYSTAAFGKWHNTPFREISPTGPFDRWPTGLGFEYYYGNMLGMSSQWEPELWRNTLPVEPPKTAAEGYHYTTDITDDAIRWLHTQRSLAPDKPYFMYFATGAAHGPHHVPPEWIEKYQGKFDQGWDQLREEIFARQKKLGVIPAETQLTPRPNGLPLWSRLSSAEKRLAARQMEVYAGFIAQTDHEIGRLVDAVKAVPGGENTLILYIVGDNGASAGSLEGGETYYAAGWAMAGTTPFQWAKGIASHFGGTRNPLVVSWPARIKDKGGVRPQFTHVTDVAATLYEVTGIPMPDSVDGVKQLPLDGVSFASSFGGQMRRPRHRVQYFEIWGNRALYRDGWIATARHGEPWAASENFDPWASYADDVWELYHIDTDFSQARNLAARHPEKLRELRALFEEEARRNDVYPLISKNLYYVMRPREKRTSSTYYAGLPSVPAFNGPFFGDSSVIPMPNFRIETEVVIPDTGAEGVILSHGSRFHGFALYVKDDRLVFESNSGVVASGAGGVEPTTIRSRAPVPRGKAAALAFEWVREQPATHKAEGGATVSAGTGRLYINGRLAGEGKVILLPAFFGSLGVGQAFGSPVSAAFQPPFTFTGTLDKVTVQVQ